MFNCIGMLPFVNFIQAQIMRDRKHYHSVPHYLLFYYGAKLLILFHVCKTKFYPYCVGFYPYIIVKENYLVTIEQHRYSEIRCKIVAFKDTPDTRLCQVNGIFGYIQYSIFLSVHFIVILH